MGSLSSIVTHRATCALRYSRALVQSRDAVNDGWLTRNVVHAVDEQGSGLLGSRDDVHAVDDLPE